MDLYKDLVDLISKHSLERKLAPCEIQYNECTPFMPLADGDTVFCPRIYDGDSITVSWISPTGDKVRIGCRINGIDTPELRGSSPHEKALAARAKERLSEAVLGKFVTIRNPGVEKYGRVLSDLQTSEHESITNYMLADPDICKPYSGGTKEKWD